MVTGDDRPNVGYFYAVEPNHGELDQASLTGQIKRLARISATEGYFVPTAMAFRGSSFHLGSLDTCEKPNSSKIIKTDLHGNITRAQ